MKIVAMIVLACATLAPVAYIAGFENVGNIIFYCGAMLAIIMSVVIMDN